MKNNSLRFMMVMCVALMLAQGLYAASKNRVKLTLKVDHENGLYRCGEDAVFTATVTKNGEPVEEGEVTLTVKTWSKKLLAKKKVVLAQGPARITATSQTPGFVLCKAIYKSGKKGDEVEVGAGFDVTKIKAAAVTPDDLDAFWKEGMDAFKDIPLDLKLTRCKTSTDEVDVFKISIANINDTRAYGYLRIPLKKKGPFPVRIFPYSAGRKPMEIVNASKECKRGVIILNASVHPHDIEPLDGSAKPLMEAYIHTYPSIGVPDKKKFYFYRAILGINRLIEYVASRPDVDLDHFVMTGKSQAGGLAFILGGMNQRFTAVAACVPGMCDHVAYRIGNMSAWPGLIPYKIRKDSVKEPIYRDFSGYYDAVNFCRKIKVPTIVSAGLVDHTCKPGVIYAAYNQIDAPKRMFTGPNDAHVTGREYKAFFDRWLAGQLGLTEVIPLDIEVKNETGIKKEGK